MTDTGKQPRRGGKRLFEPADEQRKNVKILVALGMPERAICAIVRDHRDKPISEPTFRKHFRKEIETGATELNTGREFHGRDNPRHRSSQGHQAHYG